VRALEVPRPVLGWLERQAKCSLSARAVGVAAVDESGGIHGMVAFDDVTRGSCEVHIALKSPAAFRTLAGDVFRRAFETLGVRVVLGTVPADNQRGRRIARHLGFKETHRVRDGWAEGVDLVIHELRREDCTRWLAAAKKEAA
jgi:RimJ/RimL family protein N-acetyltransferase